MNPGKRITGTRLVYSSDTTPGITRRRSGNGFSYWYPDQTPVKKEDDKQRILSLGIPPAYEDVWICPEPNGHLQATGLDDKQRKQYRYHGDWSDFRNLQKYGQLSKFAECLPRIRRETKRLLEYEPGSEKFAVGALIALLDEAAIRAGNAKYAVNGTFGATTLRKHHLKSGQRANRLSYIAKGGKKVDFEIDSHFLNEVLEEIADLPGRNLFTWIDNAGQTRHVDSSRLNDHLSEIADNDTISAKTFRTWAGTLEAFATARKVWKRDGDAASLTIKAMSEAAAERLHNTPAIARSSYIHPDVVDLAGGKNLNRMIHAENTGRRSGLRMDEARLKSFLES